jgi:hypothetical protein
LDAGVKQVMLKIGKDARLQFSEGIVHPLDHHHFAGQWEIALHLLRESAAAFKSHWLCHHATLRSLPGANSAKVGIAAGLRGAMIRSCRMTLTGWEAVCTV